MHDQASHLETLLHLETRHEELLEQLDQLDKRVESVLAEYRGNQAASLAGPVDSSAVDPLRYGM